MDILQEYAKSQPQQPRSAACVQAVGTGSVADTGLLIRLVMQLSGGKIQNTRQATQVLLGVALLALISAFSIFLVTSGGLRTLPPPPPAQT
jgi:hypothetical protein